MDTRFCKQVTTNTSMIYSLLKLFSEEDNGTTIGQLKEYLSGRHGVLPAQWRFNFCNQYFLPLQLYQVVLLTEKFSETQDLKAIRNSIAHANFEINEDGIKFKSKREPIFFNYEELGKFMHNKIRMGFFKFKIL